jgi:LacI family transcriptional regulator
VIAQDPAAIGTLSAQLLLGRIAGDRSAAELHVIPTRLIGRQSGEVPPPS